MLVNFSCVCSWWLYGRENNYSNQRTLFLILLSMYIYVYKICIYVYKICIYTYKCVYIYICICIYMHTYVCICIYTLIWVAGTHVRIVERTLCSLWWSVSRTSCLESTQHYEGSLGVPSSELLKEMWCTRQLHSSFIHKPHLTPQINYPIYSSKCIQRW